MFVISVIATFVVLCRKPLLHILQNVAQNNKDQPNIITESNNYSGDELGILAKQNQSKQLFSILNINIRSRLKKQIRTRKVKWKSELTCKIKKISVGV